MTRIRPTLSADVRAIELIDGEALFDVAKEARRPFIVSAGAFRVRAVGTSFSVRRIGSDGMKLLVAEGVVEVSRDGNTLGQVHAGVDFRVSAESAPVLATLDAKRMTGALAWRGGSIDLQGMTLAEAAAEFSRYSDLRIRIDDPALARLHIVGVYPARDAKAFARDAALSLGLRTSRSGDEIIITR